MLHFTHQQLLRSPGQHLASTPHLRLQVLRITEGRPGPLFHRAHGEVLLLVLSGSCVVVLEEEQQTMHPGDQALVADGEAFMLFSHAKDAIVQFVWLPGPNPCKPCGQQALKTFGDG